MQPSPSAETIGPVLPRLDIDVAIDALYGALYYRLLVSHEPLCPEYARTVVDTVFPGLCAAALA